MPLAAIYRRISEDPEGTELGIERQLNECRELAARLGHQVVEIFTDNDIGASTKSKKTRPEYQRMLKAARAGQFTVIIASTSSRLTRRPRENEDLIELAEQNGISYAYASSPSFNLNTADGRQIARILAASDAAESERTSERLVKENRQRAEHGEHHGGPRAYGITDDGKAHIKDEADEVSRWFDLIIAGGSIASICRDTGKHHASVISILKNPRYAGLRILSGTTYAASNPAVVPESTWRAVQAILADPSRMKNKSGRALKWMGAGLYLCSECDKPVRSGYGGGSAGHDIYRLYKHPRSHGGCGRSWKADVIDDFVIRIIAARLDLPDVADMLAKKSTPDVAKLSTEANGIRARIEQLGAEFGDDDDADLVEFRTASRRLRERLAALETRMAEAGNDGALAALAGAKSPRQAWLDMEDVHRRRAILTGLADVRLNPAPRGRPRNEGAAGYVTVTPTGN